MAAASTAVVVAAFTAVVGEDFAGVGLGASLAVPGSAADMPGVMAIAAMVAITGQGSAMPTDIPMPTLMAYPYAYAAPYAYGYSSPY